MNNKEDDDDYYYRVDNQQHTFVERNIIQQHYVYKYFFIDLAEQRERHQYWW